MFVRRFVAYRISRIHRRAIWPELHRTEMYVAVSFSRNVKFGADASVRAFDPLLNREIANSLAMA